MLEPGGGGRTLIGIAVVPAIGSFAIVTTIAVMTFILGRTSEFGLQGIFGFGVLGMILAYPVAIAVGPPTCLVMRLLRWNGALHFSIGPCLLGMVLFLVLGGFSEKHIPKGLIAASLWGVGAAATGFTFWLIVRPDRDRP